MRKNWKSFISLTLLAVMLIANTLSVNAQSYVINDCDGSIAVGENEVYYRNAIRKGIALDFISYDHFDEVFYAKHNPDVAAVVGLSKEALYAHYQNAGYTEGRIAKSLPRNVLDYQGQNYYNYGIFHFDEKRYAQEYPELVAIYGLDGKKLWNHYITKGIAEGRHAYLNYGARSGMDSYLELVYIAQSITNDTMTDREKVTVIHDWICQNTTYDYSMKKDNYINLLHDHMAICEGYADAMRFMCDGAGVKCDKISGPNHAWNRAYIDGQWLEIDVCWDDYTIDQNLPKSPYEYCLVDKATMHELHRQGGLY